MCMQIFSFTLQEYHRCLGRSQSVHFNTTFDKHAYLHIYIKKKDIDEHADLHIYLLKNIVYVWADLNILILKKKH